MDSKTISLDAWVDKKENKVLLVESDEDFVDLLFSFLTIPLGKIAELIRIQQPVFKLGCFSNLYESVENIGTKFVENESYRTMLLHPQNGAPTPYDEGTFVKENQRFVISDELEVLPASFAANSHLLSKQGKLDAEKEFRTFNIGRTEVLNILMLSLVSKTAFTETLLPHGALSQLGTADIGVGNSFNRAGARSMYNEEPKICVRLIRSNSLRRILYAEVHGEFINLLLSFLTVPLGRILGEVYAGLSTVCISHLYKSVLNLDVTKYFISNEHKRILLSPRFAPGCRSNMHLLYLQEFNYRGECSTQTRHNHNYLLPPPYTGNEAQMVKEEGTWAERVRRAVNDGGFVKGNAMFSVTGDLIITPRYTLRCLSAVKSKFNLPDSDFQESNVHIGKQEALRLLVASVFSEDALTWAFGSWWELETCFHHLRFN